jgi:hypothetical protein
VQFKVGDIVRHVGSKQISIVIAVRDSEEYNYRTKIIIDQKGEPCEDTRTMIWVSLDPEWVVKLSELEKALL